MSDIFKQGAEGTPVNRTVVRLSRSVWSDASGVHQKITMRYLRRQCTGFNLMEEDCCAAGAVDAVARIMNLSQCDDGVYVLVPHNERKDHETGNVEEWDYKLVPFTPEKAAKS